ncbi:MAG TPA: hypothetical protein VFL82_04550 [Thermomicrobiales bacterium]|nr:hypothetical protein [Thermomicrobiales bacterium]
MRRTSYRYAIVGIASLMLGLVATSVMAQTPANGTPAAASGTPASGEVTVYRATLHPLNVDAAGSSASGEATFTISGDALTIDISVHGVTPGMQHLQHFHGFADTDQKAACPTAADDKNGDGIVDLIETEPVVGTTMVPFHDDPVSMQIVNDTYPTANADGSYTYSKTVSLDALTKAFLKQFPNQQSLALDHRVVMIHGIASSTSLPDTVQSLDDIPAQVTIPVACGVIEQVQPGTPIAASPVAVATP